MKRIAIEENRSLNNMTLDELIGSLKTFEMNEKSCDSIRGNRKESVVFQLSASNEVTQSTEFGTPIITLTELDTKVSLLAKGLHKFIRKNKQKNYSSGESKQSGVSFDSPNRNKVIMCYECSGQGHIQSECPTYLRKKKSFVAAWSDDSSASEDDDCNYVAFTANVQQNSILPARGKAHCTTIVPDDETDNEDDIGTVENIIKQWDEVLESTKIKQRADGIFISQKKYARNLVKFGLKYAKAMRTPMSTTNRICRDENEESHVKFVKRIIRYVKNTVYLGIWYAVNTSNVLAGYSDADWAGDADDRKVLQVDDRKVLQVDDRKVLQVDDRKVHRH
ncbi:hypothetical protein H6P81_012895 [Aristolochia fimbriata]|uniref:CCHC-type domain-containing protein n=1 Tax=Aristolochia fimbriata TaxID=158543 RepID=A0AAV7ED51_ARIFI|nr:hypothetical protein H6P81_012895 [Aristolochia fimbriata]